VFQQISNYGYLHLIFEIYFTQMVIDRSIVQLESDSNNCDKYLQE